MSPENPCTRTGTLSPRQDEQVKCGHDSHSTAVETGARGDRATATERQKQHSACPAVLTDRWKFSKLRPAHFQST